MNEFKFPNESFSGVDMVATAHLRDFADPNKSMVVSLGSLQTISYSIHMDRKPIRSIGNINAKDYVLGPRTIAGSLIFAVFNKHFAYKMLEGVNTNIKPTYAFMVDELPPFDITISASNEYGYQAKLVIYGVRLVNEGQVMSVNDVYTENTYQFVATDIEYLTDQNGYASYTGPGYKLKIQPQLTEESKNAIDAAKVKAGIEENKVVAEIPKVTLEVKTKPAVKEGARGMAEFILKPGQETGVIRIMGDNIENKVDGLQVNIANFPNQIVRVDLKTGQYYAVYEDKIKKIKSNIAYFSIGEFVSIKRLPGMAPLIEQVTDSKIAVYSNLTEHSQVKIAQIIEGKDPIYEYVQLHGRRAVIEGLTAETKYILATCDVYDEYSSQTVEVKTLHSQEKPFNDLKQFIYTNATNFTLGDVIDYYAIVDEAKTIALGLPITTTIADAVIMIKNNLHTQIAGLKVESFPNLEEYNKKAYELTTKANMCYEIVMAAIKLSNDKSYAINRKTLALIPPVPEMIDGLSSTILTDGNTRALEFYRQYKHVSQFAAKIDKMYLSQHVSGKLAYQYLGKPGVKHYVHAMNELSQRSPRLEFYSLTDEERTNRIKEMADQHDFVTDAILDSEARIGYQQYTFNLSDDQKQRIVIKNAKAPNVPLLPPPTVLEANDSVIALDVDYRDLIGEYENEYLVVLSEAENALYDITRYKLIINKDTTTVEFTADEHGLKINRPYAIWIESKDGIQVSQCVTAYTYAEDVENDSTEEDRIRLYELNKYISRFEAALGNKMTIEHELKYAIDNLKDDSSVSEKNFCSRLIQNIMTIKPRLANEAAVINSIFQAKHDIDFITSDSFFESSVKYENRTIEFPEGEYMATVHYVSIVDDEAMVTVKTYRAVGEKLLINLEDCLYAVAYVVGKDIYTKSGLIFVDALSNMAQGYRISMEVNR